MAFHLVICVVAVNGELLSLPLPCEVEKHLETIGKMPYVSLILNVLWLQLMQHPKWSNTQALFK